MKPSSLPVCVLFFFAGVSGAAAQEFELSRRGFIYPDSTMQQLHSIVDSLNIRYRQCGPARDFYSLPQGTCHYIHLDTGDVAGAAKALEAGMAYEVFLKRYSAAKHEENLLVLRDAGTDYEEKPRLEFEAHSPAFQYSNYSISFKDTNRHRNPEQGRWIVEFTEKSAYSKQGRLEAFCVVQPFRTQALPAGWTRMIQYADCMIDTTITIFSKDAIRSSRSYLYDNDKQVPASIGAFIERVHKLTNYPAEKDPGEENDAWWARRVAWDSAQHIIVRQKMAQDRTLLPMLQTAVNDALAAGYSQADLEEYAARYYSPAKALALKRSRIVVGGCSQDQSPRYHALDIARLSAQSVNWEVFLRAHLDIMNDRFQRASDGSYAWGERGTYIGELEDLALDIPALMMGISLRMANPAGTHYFGSIGRLGRALAEAKDRPAIEAAMARMIGDAALDDFNRYIGYNLYLSYLWSLKDVPEQQAAIERFKVAAKQLPQNLALQAAANPPNFAGMIERR